LLRALLRLRVGERFSCSLLIRTFGGLCRSNLLAGRLRLLASSMLSRTALCLSGVRLLLGGQVGAALRLLDRTLPAANRLEIRVESELGDELADDHRNGPFGGFGAGDSGVFASCVAAIWLSRSFASITSHRSQLRRISSRLAIRSITTRQM